MKFWWMTTPEPHVWTDAEFQALFEKDTTDFLRGCQKAIEKIIWDRYWNNASVGTI